MNMKKVVTGSLAGIMAVSAMAVNTFADLTTGTTVNQEAKEKTWNLIESGWKIQYPTSFTGKITYTMADADANGSVAENVAKYKAKLVYYIKAFDAKSDGTPDYTKPAVIDGDVKLAITGKHTNYYGNVTSQTVTATATPVKLANGLYKVTFWTTRHDDNLTGGNTISMSRFTYPRAKPNTSNTINESTEFTYNLSYNIVGAKVYTSKNDANKALNGLNVWSQVDNNSSIGTDYDSKELNKGLTWWRNNNNQVPSTEYNGEYKVEDGGETPPDANYPNYKNALAALATAKTSFTTAETAYNNAKNEYDNAKKAINVDGKATSADWENLKAATIGNILANGAASAAVLGATGAAALNNLFGDVIKAETGDKWGSIGLQVGGTAASLKDALTGTRYASAYNSILAFVDGYDTGEGYQYNETAGTSAGVIVENYHNTRGKLSAAYQTVAQNAYAEAVPGNWDITVSSMKGDPAVFDATGKLVTNATPLLNNAATGIGASYFVDASIKAIENLITAANVKATLADGSPAYRALAKQIDLALTKNGVDTIAGTTVNSGSSLGRQLSNIHGALDKHDDGDLSDHNDVDKVLWTDLQTLTDDPEAKIAILHYLYNTKGATLTFNFAYDDNGDEEGKGKDGFDDDSDKLSGSKNALKEMSLRANEVGVMTEAKEMKDWSVSFDWDEIMQNTFGYDVNNTGNIWKLEAKLNMKNESLHDAIYDGNLYLKSVTVKVPEKTFTILAAGEGTSDSTEDVVAPESSDASSESSSEAESSEASSVESSEPAPETPVTNPSTGNAPIALAVIPVAVAAAAVIIKKRG